jgi:hypothetical protein
MALYWWARFMNRALAAGAMFAAGIQTGIADPVDQTPYITGDHVACATRDEFQKIVDGGRQMPLGCIMMPPGLKERFITMVAAPTPDNPTFVFAEVLVWPAGGGMPQTWWTMIENLIPAPR